ncbi:hypothetical protein N7489_011437 [Penicillium chrysogenum]|uniref:U1-type domain-containing protein n=1 Tax=Penicillium chrysogenum TaxID=5076 RepID=A0ABQ8W1L9_PENCH|nr:uncharacterized protein N7489_011437 [Penicillium chrysogenum]KAJ5230729.1 hypothetical protein N7489_011437 [Penicillium chrysogenum]KAJ5254604.1 hypothetical protein N7505_011813 [Penicillium chrysogenum]KAJ6163037.1 hypothetical protein N7497_003016 [Penicillium chrysogenum]
MAEFWKSAPRYWCKQCKVFIRDTPFEKTQHEASPKHQGSLKRFLRQIHNDNEQKQRDSQLAKAEVERLRKAVGGGSSTDKDSAKGKAPPPAPKSAERPASLEDRKKQIAQLAAMGVAVPQEFRADMAIAGDWQTTSETVIEAKQGLDGPTKSVGIRKRKLEGEEEGDEHAPEPIINKGWGSRMRQYPGAQEEEGLDDLLASTKDIKRTKTFTPKVELDEQETATEPTAPTIKTEDDPTKPEAQETNGPVTVKTEEPAQSLVEPVIQEKPQSEDAAPGVVFKKRKPKAMRK